MQYVIDRLEEELAICENDDREMISVPRKELPESVNEGDVILQKEDGSWTLDADAANKRRERIRKKMMDLFD